MLTLAPFFFLISATLAIYLMRLFPRGRGYAWLTALLAALIAWLGVLAMHWYPAQPLVIQNWRPYDPSSADAFMFSWDSISWPFAFLMVSLGLAVIFTAPARFSQSSNPQAWAANLAFSGFGLLAILAATPLSVVIAWTILDLVELAFVLGFISETRFRREAIAALIARFLGTALLLAAMIIARSEGEALTFENIQSSFALFIFGSVVLRLGIIPLNLPYLTQLPLQHGLTNTLRSAGMIAALVILARLPAEFFFRAISPFWVTLIALGAAYGALMWLVARDEVRGRPYWFLAFSALALLAASNGHGDSAPVWAVSIVVSGGLLLLYSARSDRLRFLPALALLGFTGMPFTPASSTWLAFASTPLWLIFYLLVLVILSFGFIRHAARSAEPLAAMERWGQGLYFLGLFLLLLSGWLVVYFGLQPGLVMGGWWAALILILILSAGGLAVRRGLAANWADRWKSIPLAIFVRESGDWIINLLQLTWLARLGETLFKAAQSLVFASIDLLEGQGGVLWALLLLALLFTILGAGTSI